MTERCESSTSAGQSMQIVSPRSLTQPSSKWGVDTESDIVDTTSALDGTSDDNDDEGESSEQCDLSHNKDGCLSLSHEPGCSGERDERSGRHTLGNVSVTSAQRSRPIWSLGIGPSVENGKTNSSNIRLVSRRKRSRMRRRTVDDIDNDHDGDIDRTDNEDDNDLNRANSDHDLIAENRRIKQCTAYLSHQQEASFINNLNRWRQDKPTFLRSRIQRNRQQEMKKQQHNHGAIDHDRTQSCLARNGINLGINFIDPNRISQFELGSSQDPRVNSAQLSENWSRIGSAYSYVLKKLSSYVSPTHTSPCGSPCKLSSSQVSNTDTELDDNHPQGQQFSMTSNNPRYQTLHGSDECQDPRSKISGAKSKDHRRYDSARGYSKLNHHHYRETFRDSKFYELQRCLLLLIIIGVCCFLLWNIHRLLRDEQNFLGFVETPSELGRYEHYAVSTDAKPCAKIGSSLLAKGGSAIDAAIGTLLCMGVTIPNSMGLGGGCIWTIYNRTTRQAIVIDGREIAPDYSSENMFANSSLAASRGSLSIGVPGELASYWKAHQMFGKLKWSELFDESISMAEIGSPMVEHLSFALRQQSHAQYITPPLAAIYKGPTNNQYLKEGEILVQKALGNTLRRIRNNGAAEFYGGQTGKLFVDDLQKQGGKMTLENLMKYEALIKEPLKVDLGSDLTLFTPPPPASGIVLSIILRIMKGLGYYKNLKPQNNQDDSNLYYHRLAEAFKYAYAQRAGLEDNPDDPERMEQLLKKLSSDKFIEEVVSKITNETHNDSRYGGDEYFSEDHGTAHVSVLDSEGNAVAVTTSVNLYFGSGMVSPSTGIVYNDVMDDFVSPNLVNKFALAPSKFNRIRPGKRPVSSMAPSVFVDADGNARLIIGASGGAKITTAIATVSLRNCFLGEDIKTAIDGPRIHHQFLPNKVWFELNFPDEILVSLKERGHSLNPILDRSSVVMAVANDRVDGKNSITANSDHRKGGAVHGS